VVGKLLDRPRRQKDNIKIHPRRINTRDSYCFTNFTDVNTIIIFGAWKFDISLSHFLIPDLKNVLLIDFIQI
jgi:hypothetical protein